MNIDESKVPPQAMTAVRESLDAAYGSTHKGDPSLARDLGVTLSVEQDEVTPPAEFVGNSLVNKPVNDAARAMRKGEPVELEQTQSAMIILNDYNAMNATQQSAFRTGLLYASILLVRLNDRNYEQASVLQQEANRLRSLD